MNCTRNIFTEDDSKLTVELVEIRSLEARNSTDF